ncbi:hypothetical protein PQQ86_03450 [Paraburkholderia sediminicola]|jgi:hypothetical protein|uniref:hypothetical protein n=1 Tax=Paraburkholderia sediminicola TaxID=458836 RepID=UPI0038B797BD
MCTTNALVRVDLSDLNELGVSPLDRQNLPPAPSLSNEKAAMQSRSVAESVIQRFDYDISTPPRPFLIRGAIAEKFAVNADHDKSSGLVEITYSVDLARDVELAQTIHVDTVESGKQPLRRDPQGVRRAPLGHIGFIQSVLRPLLATFEPRGSLYVESACSSSRQRLLWRASTLGEA